MGPFDDPAWREYIMKITNLLSRLSKAKVVRVDHISPAVIRSRFYQIGDQIIFRGYDNCILKGTITGFKRTTLRFDVNEDIFCIKKGHILFKKGSKRKITAKHSKLFNMSFRILNKERIEDYINNGENDDNDDDDDGEDELNDDKPPPLEKESLS